MPVRRTRRPITVHSAPSGQPLTSRAGTCRTNGRDVRPDLEHDLRMPGQRHAARRTAPAPPADKHRDTGRRPARETTQPAERQRLTPGAKQIRQRQPRPRTHEHHPRRLERHQAAVAGRGGDATGRQGGRRPGPIPAGTITTRLAPNTSTCTPYADPAAARTGRSPARSRADETADPRRSDAPRPAAREGSPATAHRCGYACPAASHQRDRADTGQRPRPSPPVDPDCSGQLPCVLILAPSSSAAASDDQPALLQVQQAEHQQDQPGRRPRQPPPPRARRTPASRPARTRSAASGSADPSHSATNAIAKYVKYAGRRKRRRNEPHTTNARMAASVTS